MFITYRLYLNISQSSCILNILWVQMGLFLNWFSLDSNCKRSEIKFSLPNFGLIRDSNLGPIDSDVLTTQNFFSKGYSANHLVHLPNFNFRIYDRSWFGRIYLHCTLFYFFINLYNFGLFSINCLCNNVWKVHFFTILEKKSILIRTRF